MTIKKLNYFKGQFLGEDDFKDEQRYHVESQRLHNENLHTWGIAKGLEVTSSDDKKHLKISKGMGIDKDGKQIVIDEDREIKVSKFSEQSFYLTVLHEEVETDPDEWTGKNKNTRVEEKPHFDQENSKPDDTSTKIILAKVITNPETEMIVDIDLKDRKYAGIVAGDLEAKSIAFRLPPANPDKWPRINGVDGSKPGLEISADDTRFIGNLGVSGILSGNLKKDSVGQEQIADNSIPISKMNCEMTSELKEIKANATHIARTETIEPDQDPSKNHLFFFTSVIPTSQDSSIEWWWEVENKENHVYYNLKVKNPTDKPVQYHFKYYKISEI